MQRATTMMTTTTKAEAMTTRRTTTLWKGPSAFDDPVVVVVVVNPVEYPVDEGDGQSEVRHWTESDSSAPTNKSFSDTARSVCDVPQGMS